MPTTKQNRESSGFALLITLITIGAVLAISLSLIELSIKQLDLSVDSRDSEIAFQAVNAGIECAQRVRRVASTTLEVGAASSFTCLGASPTVGKLGTLGLTTQQVPAEGDVYRYVTRIDWGTAPASRCSEIDMVIMMSDITASTGVAVTDFNTIYADYSGTKTCQPGGRCTIAVARGYNSTCANRNAVGVLRREILLEF